MKPLKPHRQKPGLCGPASLKILLSHYGKEFTEDDLAKICRATAEVGTDHAGLIDGLKSIGENPIVKENATIDDLRYYMERDTPVIVGWFSEYGEPDEHYSVVYEVTDEIISMMDPERDEGTVTMPIEDFEKVWYDSEGAGKQRIQHWMLAIPSF